LGSIKSDWISIDIGAPQGSWMGPFCFNIFINDLLICIAKKCEVYNYADDNSICCHGTLFNDVKSSLENVSTIMIEWFKINNLKANPEKFQAIFFDKGSHVAEELNIDSKAIKISEVIKLLGVYIDRNLEFSYHISDMCKKAGKKVNALSRIAYIVDESSKRLLYDCFISSHFSYCTLVWKYCKLGDIIRIEKIQKRALKVIHKEGHTPQRLECLL
jgi:hypothetical protein